MFTGLTSCPVQTEENQQTSSRHVPRGEFTFRLSGLKSRRFLVGLLQTNGTSLFTEETLWIWELICFKFTENEEFTSLTSISAFALWIQVQQKHNIYSLDRINKALKYPTMKFVCFLKHRKFLHPSYEEQQTRTAESWRLTTAESLRLYSSQSCCRDQEESRVKAAAPPLSHAGLEEVNWCCSCFRRGAAL